MEEQRLTWQIFWLCLATPVIGIAAQEQGNNPAMRQQAQFVPQSVVFETNADVKKSEVISYQFADQASTLLSSIHVGAELPPHDAISLPPECHAQAYREDSFSGFEEWPLYRTVAHGRDRYVWKYDVVCVAPVLEITTDIVTNGGSVFLLADEVIISASINTRVRRKFELSDYFLPQPKKIPQNGYLGRYDISAFRSHRNVYGSLTDSNADPQYGTQKTLMSFSDYYSCDYCLVGKSGVQYVDRMPDGATPPFDGIPKPDFDGISAPSDEVNRLSYRSGDVYVYSPKIEISHDGNAPIGEILVVGIPGGLGGLGEPHTCTGWPRVGGWSCGTRPGQQSKSALGGPGGDAGSVYFYTEGELWPGAKAHEISGGPGASGKTFASPLWRQQLTGRFYDDFKEIEDLGPRPDGAKGKFEFFKVPRGQLFKVFMQQLVLTESLRIYSFSELASRSLDDSSVRARSFSGYIASAVDKSLRDRLAHYSSSIIPAISDQPLPAPPRTAAVLCPKESIDTIFRGEVAVLVGLYAATCTSTGRMLALEDYLIQIGGVFALPNRNIGTEIQLDQIYNIGQLTEEALAEIKLQVAELTDVSIGILKSVEQARLESQRKSIEAAIAAARAEDDGPLDDIKNIAQLVASIYTGGVALIGAYDALESLSADGTIQNGENVPYTEQDRERQRADLQQAAKDVYKAHAEATGAYEALKSEQVDVAQPLEEQLRQVLDSMHRFSADVAERRIANVNTKLDFTDDLFRSRSRYATFERGVITRAPELISSVLTGFLADPARDIDQLNSNSEALSLYIRDFPTRSTLLRFRPFKGTCDNVKEVRNDGQYVRNDEDCVAIESGDLPRILYGEFQDSDGNTVEWPLYLVASGAAKFKLPLYGISRYRLSPYMGELVL